MSLRSQPAFDTYDRPALDGPMCIPRRVHECTCAAYQGQCNKFTLCDPSSLCCPAPRVPMSCEALTTRRMPADRATAIVTVLGFIVLALAVAVADAMKDPASATELSLAFPWPSLALLPPGMSAESLARDPLFYAGFVACFGWWWVLLGRPAFATKA